MLVMDESKFAVGERVFTAGPTGEVLEVRWINDREFIYGVVDRDGEVRYYKEDVLHPAG